MGLVGVRLPEPAVSYTNSSVPARAIEPAPAESGYVHVLESRRGSMTAKRSRDSSGCHKDGCEDHPWCNRCGESLRNQQFLEVQQHWGYESVGKDTLEDRWRLCLACEQKLLPKPKVVCSKCGRAVYDVMVGLAVQNPLCVFKTEEEARESWGDAGQHFCGLEYALVSGHVLCELCYEDMVLSFKIPARLYHAYQGSSGGEPIVESRIEGVLKGPGFLADEAAPA